MKEFKISTKDLRKAAFAVGFGLALGKHAASWLETVVSGVFGNWMVNKAKNGDAWAQNICTKAGVNYKGDSEEKESEE